MNPSGIQAEVIFEGGCFRCCFRVQDVCGVGADTLRDSKDCEVGEFAGVILLDGSLVASIFVVRPEDHVGSVEVVAVNLVSDFAREPEKSTVGFVGAHVDGILMMK